MLFVPANGQADKERRKRGGHGRAGRLSAWCQAQGGSCCRAHLPLRLRLIGQQRVCAASGCDESAASMHLSKPLTLAPKSASPMRQQAAWPIPDLGHTQCMAAGTKGVWKESVCLRAVCAYVSPVCRPANLSIMWFVSFAISFSISERWHVVRPHRQAVTLKALVAVRLSSMLVLLSSRCCPHPRIRSPRQTAGK